MEPRTIWFSCPDPARALPPPLGGRLLGRVNSLPWKGFPARTCRADGMREVMRSAKGKREMPPWERFVCVLHRPEGHPVGLVDASEIAPPAAAGVEDPPEGLLGNFLASLPPTSPTPVLVEEVDFNLFGLGDEAEPADYEIAGSGAA